MGRISRILACDGGPKFNKCRCSVRNRINSSHTLGCHICGIAHPDSSVFLGEFNHTLDDKGRLTVPSKFRSQLATGLVATRNPVERCLLVMPMEKWQEVAAKVNALPLVDPGSAALRRTIFSAAENLSPDKQGRILISPRLRAYAEIESEVVIAGVYSFVELWTPHRWRERVIAPLEAGALDAQLFATLDI